MNTQVEEVPLDLVDLGPNVREVVSEESLWGMKLTAEKRGIREPVTVRKNGNRFVLIKGFRRFFTAQSAGHSTIPAMIDDRLLSMAEVLVEQLTENVQRLDLTDLEKARGIDLLMQKSRMSAADVAAELGLATGQVSKLRSLLTLPARVQEMVAKNELPAGTAFEIARTGNADSQISLAEEAVRSGLTRDAVAGKVKSQKRPAAVPSAAAPVRVTATLGSGRSITVAGTGLTFDRFIEWLEELLGKARRARPKGLELTTFIKMLRDQARKEIAS